MSNKSFNIRLSERDQRCLAWLHRVTGIHNTSEVIRFAMRQHAEARGYADPAAAPPAAEATGTEG